MVATKWLNEAAEVVRDMKRYLAKNGDSPTQTSYKSICKMLSIADVKVVRPHCSLFIDKHSLTYSQLFTSSDLIYTQNWYSSVKIILPNKMCNYH